MSVNVKFIGDARALEKAQKNALKYVRDFEKNSIKSLKNVRSGGFLPLNSQFLSLAAGAAALRSAITAAVDFEKLKLGLRAVTDESENVEAHIKRLKLLAKDPGLGFEQALKGSIELQGVGFKVKKTEKILKEFGNAIALSGAGAPELARVTTQLGQLSAKGKVLTQDLRPIIEAAPVLARSLKAAFGTVSADDISQQVKDSEEFIQRLLAAMEDLPRAPKAAAESFQNFNDSAKEALAKVGEPIVQSLIPVLDDLIKALDDNPEALANFGKVLATTLDILVKFTPALGAFAAGYIALKAAQKGIQLSEKIKATIVSIQASARATIAETAALKANTAAQRQNASARNVPNFSGKATAKTYRQVQGARDIDGNQLPDTLAFALADAIDKSKQQSAKGGVKAGLAYSKAFAKSAASSLKTRGGALGVSALGAVGTSLLPESHLLGGKAGSSILDGISGALALAGPIGIAASLSIQAVQAGVALGTLIADGIIDAMDNDHIEAPDKLLPDEFFKALDLQNREAAMKVLIARKAEFQEILEKGDKINRINSSNAISSIDKQIVGLDRLLAKVKLRADEEAKLNAVRDARPVENQFKLSDDAAIELRLLKAQIAGDAVAVRNVELRKKVLAEMNKLRESGLVPEEKIFGLATRIVAMREQAAKAVKKSKDDAQEHLAIQKRINGLLEKGSEVYVDSLSAEKQLQILAKKKEELFKDSGENDVVGVFRAAESAKKSGNLVEAERLLKIARALQELEKKTAGIKDQQSAAARNDQAVDDAQKEYALSQALNNAKAVGNDKLVAAKERELDLLKESQRIENLLNITRAEALKLAEQNVAAQEAAAAAAKRIQTNDSRGDFATDLKALELEAGGRKEEAEALREKAAILSRAKGLQISLNTSAKNALRLARKEAALKKQIEENGDSKKKRRRGIRDVTGLRKRGLETGGLRTGNLRTGNLTRGIEKKARDEKNAAAVRNDPSLNFLQQINENQAELVKLWKGVGLA